MTDFQIGERLRCPNGMICKLGNDCPGVGRLAIKAAGEDIEDKVLEDARICMAGCPTRREQDQLMGQEAEAVLGNRALVDDLVQGGAERLVTVVSSAARQPAFDPSLYVANLIRVAGSEDAA